MDKRFFNLYSTISRAWPSPARAAASPTRPSTSRKRSPGAPGRGAGRRAGRLPELGLSAYSCDDLFHQRALLDAVLDALAEVSRRRTRCRWRWSSARRCASTTCCSIVRWWSPAAASWAWCRKATCPIMANFTKAGSSAADNAAVDRIDAAGPGRGLRSGTDFRAGEQPLFRFHVEICEDVWVPVPPSSFAALAGATVLVNLSASNVWWEERLPPPAGQPAVGALPGGLPVHLGRPRRVDHRHGLGRPVADLRKGRPAGRVRALPGRLAHHLRRRRPGTPVAGPHAHDHLRAVGAPPCARGREIPRPALRRWRCRSRKTCPCPHVERFPYVPADGKRRDERCTEVYNIQVQALMQRLQTSGHQKVVIGVSGGLDSTHALLVCAKAHGPPGLPRTNILAYTMPGFATSERTLRRRALMAWWAARRTKSTSARAASRC
jgi:NAD+ synthase (glutamine-hydrolysing)